MQCDLTYGFLKCAIPEDAVDVDLKVHTLKGIHTFRKDYKSQMNKCSPWGTKVQPYPSLEKKMVESVRSLQTTTTPFANRPYQPRSKVVVEKHNLVQPTRPNRAKLSHPRKINVRKLSKATQ